VPPPPYTRDQLEEKPFTKGVPMLWTIAVLLLILWLLGMVSSYTLGGFIHILLVLAIVAVLIRLIQGRSPAL
jgi:phosphatidylserine synthase